MSDSVPIEESVPVVVDPVVDPVVVDPVIDPVIEPVVDAVEESVVDSVVESVVNPMKETLVEEPVVAIKSKTEMTLSEILMDFLLPDSNKIVITPKLKQMIALLKVSEDTISHLENMEVLFAKIVEDKQINVMDMGAIIELLKEMYIMYDTMRMKVTAEEVGNVFKVLAQEFVRYKLSNQVSDEEKDVIIGSIFTIITLCTQMIDLKETTKQIKKRIGCLPCF